MKGLSKVSQWLWGIGLFTIPFNIFVLVWESPGQGFFNPYANVILTVSETAILTAAALYLAIHALPRKIKGLALITVGVTALSVAVSENTLSAGGAALHVLAALGSAILILENAVPFSRVRQILLISVIIQVFMTLGQVAVQHDLGLQWLGESELGPDLPGVAKLTIGGLTLIRGYGTLPHANVLAGFCLMGWFLADTLPSAKKRALMLLMGIGLLLAASKAALLALAGALILTKRFSPNARILLGIGLYALIRFSVPYWLHQDFIEERWLYTKISGSMILENPLGVGLHQFTTVMQRFTEIKLAPWQFQPVHNIYLLIVSEGGVAGAIFMLLGLKKWIENSRDRVIASGIVIGFLIIGLFDHYLFSLPQGILLAGLVVGISLHPSVAPTKSG